MEKYEINKYLETFQEKIKDLESALDIKKIEEKNSWLNEKINAADFWNDSKAALLVIEENKELVYKLDSFKAFSNQLADIEEFLAMEESEPEILADLEEMIYELDKKLRDFEIEILLNEEYDKNNAILELHPGAGGVESMDWCEMLYRMYQRFCTSYKLKFEVINYLAGEEAGIKSATIKVSGKNAYGYLKCERGVHRLVRISPFDSNKKRHTSFCSIDVMPEIGETTAVTIRPEDIRIDVFRSSGAGGQSVNTTDSAVRVTHLPTGLVVSCQNERSQIANRESALIILKSKLLDLELRKRAEELQAIKGTKMDIGWGSQIRSYVFCPYTLVKDHRTDYENSNVQSVMDGNIMVFIEKYLKYLIGAHRE
ncbi:MAG: peptide chain release factor 2 [Erysipelotrichales bacterium]|nr:peptide chain release factor 2 [Erysipelotrichales bacterium]